MKYWHYLPYSFVFIYALVLTFHEAHWVVTLFWLLCILFVVIVTFYFKKRPSSKTAIEMSRASLVWAAPFIAKLIYDAVILKRNVLSLVYWIIMIVLQLFYAIFYFFIARRESRNMQQ